MATDETRRDEAARILDRVDRDAEALGSLSLGRAARRAGGHFAGRDAEPDDRIEVWGRRIGRGLSVVLAAGLFWLLGYQLGWW